MLYANGAEHYSWSPATGIDNKNIATPTAKPTESITYTVTGYNAANYNSSTGEYECVATAQVHVEVRGDTVWRNACKHYEWKETHKIYHNEGYYTYHLKTVNGCDSLRVLALSMGSIEIDTIEAEVCTRYYWGDADTMITNSGVYRYQTHHEEACDSALVLNLNILPCVDNVAPDNVDQPSCTSQPPGDAFGMKVLYECNGINSMSTPMAGDVDGDGVVEIIACRDNGGNPWNNNGLYVFNGQTGALKYTINTEWFALRGQCMSIADVDGDGVAELFLEADDKQMRCYDATGQGLKWHNPTRLDNRYILMTADINGDGRVELVAGANIYDAQTGTLLLQGTQQWTGRGFGVPHCGNYNDLAYYMQALADIDHDGQLEVCAGNTLYKPVITNNTGTAGNSWSVVRQAENRNEITSWDGQTFMADFDNDGDMDICVIGYRPEDRYNAYIYVWDGQTSDILAYQRIALSGNYSGEPHSPSIPFCGDLDGNGTPEIIFNHPCGMFALSYDDTLDNHIRIMHNRITRFAETAGFTVFDFNQDGKNEIVYRNTSFMVIVDGITLRDLCPQLTTYSGTICEYPIIADVNGDGHAEIIVNSAYYGWNGSNSSGKVLVFGSAQLDAWGSARKVWNQWAYSSVNINDDMTVPQHQFDIATTFPNGKEPFNGFLRQMPHLDQKGDIYVNVSDISPTTANIDYSEKGASLTVDYCNGGDSRLNAPYYVTLYCDNYRGEKIETIQVDNTIDVGHCDQQPFEIPMEKYCHLKCDSIAIALNDAGNGIAQHGGSTSQPECDTLNNVIKVPFKPFKPVCETLHIHACDSFTWHRGHNGDSISTTYTQSTQALDSILDHNGCDSMRALDLYVGYSFADSTINTVCDTFTWFVTDQTYNRTIDQQVNFRTFDDCDSIWRLKLTVHYSFRYDTIATISDTNLPAYFIDQTYYYDVRNDLFHYTTIHGCDSNYHYSLYIDYHRQSCDGYLYFPNLVTPNGDGINDRFVIPALLDQDCYPHNELYIYNRWGKQVYQQTDIHHPDQFWDPTGVPPGPYFFNFKGHGTSKATERHGVVEVIIE